MGRERERNGEGKGDGIKALKLPRCEIPLSTEFSEVLDIKKEQLLKALILCQMWLYEPYFLTRITSPFFHLLAMLRP